MINNLVVDEDLMEATEMWFNKYSQCTEQSAYASPEK